MNLLGYDAIGLDVNDRSLRLARLLAKENDLPDDRFVKASRQALPFEDDSFDVVALISSLEHIDDPTLSWLVPELARVCRGVVFIQVPSAMKVSDDHTGLKFVPWMPAAIAAMYVALRGKRYRYLISESSKWDVIYRNLNQIERRFKPRFSMHMVPAAHAYPPCTPGDAVFDVRKILRVGPVSVTIRIPLLFRHFRRAAGTRIEHFFPYYNVVFRK
jgi:SAM-dependent methyltransferase